MVYMLRGMVFSIALGFASHGLAQPSDSEGAQKLVRLDVAATNAAGDPVTDLHAAEIQIREDGKLRPLVFSRFAGNKRPLAPAAPGEFVNSPAPAPTLILLDRWNERMMTTAAAWSGITAGLQRMESVDRVYIYFLTNHGDLFPVHPLPATDADLRDAPAPSAKELSAKLDDAVRKLQGFRDIDVQDPVLRANTTFQALSALGTQMASISGRKNLIWVTHGIPLLTRLLNGEWVDFTPQVRSFSAAAAHSQIAMYTVQESAQGAGADPIGESRPTLQMFSALTGGRWYPSDDVDRALADSLADSRGRYRVAYYSPIREKDRKEHKIRFDSTRKGVHLLAREGYFPDVAEPDTDVVEDAVFNGERRSPLEATEILLQVGVSRNAEKKTIHLDIRIDPADLFLERRGEKYQGGVGVMLAFYSNGFLKKASPARNVDIDLTQQQFEKGIVIPEDTPDYEGIEKIRVMVFDRGLHGLGSVTIPAQ